MKILLVNPRIDAEHKIVKAIEALGHAVLIPADAEEAWGLLQLHGTSVDLAVIHREGDGSGNSEAGLKLISKIKGDLSQSDLPFILSSEQWGDPEFASHQRTTSGANAYLRWPYTDIELIDLIRAVSGHVPPQADPVESVAIETMAPSPPSVTEQVLEDTRSVIGGGASMEVTSPGIVLEAPQLDDSRSISIHMPSSEASETPEVPETPEAVEVPSSQEPISLGHISLLDLQVEKSALIEVPVPEPTGSFEPTIHWGDAGESEPSVALTEPRKSAPGESRSEASEPDSEAMQEMPYLYQGSGGAKSTHQTPDLNYALSQPVGDAVVPGGAANAPDVETLKKYLLLREQDVAVLSTQLRTVQEQVGVLENLLRDERMKGSELSHLITEQKRRIEDFEKEKEQALEQLQLDMNELKFQLKNKVDKARLLETQVREAAEQTEHLKERVRSDIRKIRVREKELENRLEIMKKDSEALISSRENKIIDLKRKIDLLEFNMDLLQDQYMREKESSAMLKEKLSRAAQVVRVAGGLLESQSASIDGDIEETSKSKKQEAS